MKEIGGYLDLSCGQAPPYHPKALPLNSGRSAFRHIIRILKIKKIYLPYYTCPVVWTAAMREGCQIIPYDIDQQLRPINITDKDAYLLYTNYFGLCDKIVTELSAKFPRLIIDNAQAFYATMQGCVAFYSPRKFFGLPDGGLALLFCTKDPSYKTSTSYTRCSHLLKRHDRPASFAYADFKKNDRSLSFQPVQKMSNLTKALMGNIDYSAIKEKRIDNFRTLHEGLGKRNILKITTEHGVPMAYPFMTRQAGLRENLIKNKIYVATYWPQDPSNACMSSSAAQSLAQEILPLPLDQRYGKEDMDRILEVLCA